MNLDDRIRAYLDRVPPCIAGQNGDTHLFKVACILWNGFGLSEDETLRFLEYFNTRCEPPWDDYRLAYKAQSAANAVHQKPRGHLLGGVTKPTIKRDRYAREASAPSETFRIAIQKTPDHPDVSQPTISLNTYVSILPSLQKHSIPEAKETREASGAYGTGKLIRTIPAPKTDLFAVWYMNDRFDETAHWQHYGQLQLVGKIFVPVEHDQATIWDQNDPDFISSLIEYRAWLTSQPSKSSDHHTQSNRKIHSYVRRKDAPEME